MNVLCVVFHLSFCSSLFKLVDCGLCSVFSELENIPADSVINQLSTDNNNCIHIIGVARRKKVGSIIAGPIYFTRLGVWALKINNKHTHHCLELYSHGENTATADCWMLFTLTTYLEDTKFAQKRESHPSHRLLFSNFSRHGLPSWDHYALL